MERDRIIQQVEASDFIENNGAVIRIVNILSGEWKRLSTIRGTLTEISEGDFIDSVSFLQKADYIKLRTIPDRVPIECCDAELKLTEVSLTAQGTRLARGIVKDPAVSI